MDPTTFVPGSWPAVHKFEALFPQSRPIHVDLGTGLGHFTADMADLHADTNWLAIEMDGPVTRRAVRRLDRVSTERIRVFCGDARSLFLEFIPPRSVEHIWINFPDPWPKDRHQERRHTHPWMLSLLISRLTDSGEIHLATDVPQYLEEFIERMSTFSWCRHGDSGTWARSELPVQTKYERKWRSSGKMIHYGDWSVVSPDQRPAPQVAETVQPPGLPIPKCLPAPGITETPTHLAKIFPADRRSPGQCRFVLVDKSVNLSTTGTIDTADGVSLNGVWTKWKVDLIRQILSEQG